VKLEATYQVGGIALKTLSGDFVVSLYSSTLRLSPSSVSLWTWAAEICAHVIPGSTRRGSERMGGESFFSS
jgi:hypothetical protein